MTKTVALVGTAHIHTPAYRAFLSHRDDVHVPFVWDHDLQRAEESAHELGAEPTADSDRIWSDPSIQAVVICSETARHPELLSRAVASGKAIFVEKPIAFTAADAVSVAEDIMRSGNVFHTGFFLRHHQSIRFLHDAVMSGKFGQISRIHASLSHSAVIDGWFDTNWQWMADPATLGADAFFDLGVHLIDLLKWFGGPVDQVIYSSSALLHRYADVSEFGIGMLRFRNGQLGVVETSWIDDSSPTTFTIHGSRGTATLSDDGLIVRGHAADQCDWMSQPPLTLSVTDGLAAFLDALDDREADLVSVREAMETMTVTDAFTRSRTTGSWQTVEDIPPQAGHMNVDR